MEYRVGRKQKRAILDENGLEVALFSRGQEQLAQQTCDLLNGVKKLNIDDVSKCEHKETKISGGNGFAFKVICKDCGETV